MKYKCLIFDLGGVIININPSRAINEFSRISNNKPSNEFEFIDYRFLKKELKKKNIFFEFEKGSIKEEFFRNEIIKNLNVKLDNDEFNRIWNLVILNINTDLLESIFKLRNRFSLMVLSNTNSIHKNYFEKLMVNEYGYGFNKFFDKVFYSHEMFCRKPEKKIYEMVIDECGFKPSDILFFDDMKENITSAKLNGIDGYHVENKKDLINYISSLI